MESPISAPARRPGASGARSRPAIDPRLLLVRQHLERNTGRCVRLAELERLAGMSRYHLCRRFKRAFGMPPYQYLKHARLHHAKSLLIGGMPASRVAHEAGFSDHSHLARQFKLATGVSPDRFRRHHCGNPDGALSVEEHAQQTSPTMLQILE